MSELLRPHEREAIRTQFETLGHVGIVGAYSSTDTTTLVEQFPMFGRLHVDAPGEQKASTARYRPHDFQPVFKDFLADIHSQTLKLGDAIWPEETGYYLQYISMLPNTVGRNHQDTSGFIGAVAITTPRGRSIMSIEDGSEYELDPGTAVYLNPDRRLWHQGSVVGSEERTGLVISVYKP